MNGQTTHWTYKCFCMLAFALVVALPATSSFADFVINDDLIVDGSACIGFDCVNGESFGFDTLRLKENNLRIKFDDTSTSASFPRNDWTIGANETSNGGLEKFFIEDVTGGRIPFTIEAGAPTNSLYVDDGGRIGLGTSSPIACLHCVDGNTPTLRLEQDGSSGFTPQTWDLAGNETNFFVRDATNGSKLPFRIRPNSPTSSIDLNSSATVINEGSASLDFRVEGDTDANLLFSDGSEDRVGIGTDSPEDLLHVAGTLRVKPDAGNTTLRMNSVINSARNILFTNNGNDFFIQSSATAGTFKIRNSALTDVVTIKYDNTGATCDGNTWANASSREVKDNIAKLNASEALKAFKELEPVKFNYKDNPDELSLGFIAEDAPELVARNDRKHLTAMDITAVLTKAMQQQQSTIEEQQQTIAELKERLDKLEQQ